MARPACSRILSRHPRLTGAPAVPGRPADRGPHLYPPGGFPGMWILRRQGHRKALLFWMTFLFARGHPLDVRLGRGVHLGVQGLPAPRPGHRCVWPPLTYTVRVPVAERAPQMGPVPRKAAQPALRGGRPATP